MKDGLDFCTTCGSHDIKEEDKEFEVDMPNPGKISVSSRCMVCQECGSAYYDDEHVSELSKKFNAERARLAK